MSHPSLLRPSTTAEAVDGGRHKSSGSGVAANRSLTLPRIALSLPIKAAATVLKYDPKLLTVRDSYVRDGVRHCAFDIFSDRVESLLELNLLVARIILRSPDQSSLILIVEFEFLGPSFYVLFIKRDIFLHSFPCREGLVGREDGCGQWKTERVAGQ